MKLLLIVAAAVKLYPSVLEDSISYQEQLTAHAIDEIDYLRVISKVVDWNQRDTGGNLTYLLLTLKYDL